MDKSCPQYKASGNYYARVRLKGKLIWKSLKTDALAVAKLRLGDFLKEEGHRAEVVESAWHAVR